MTHNDDICQEADQAFNTLVSEVVPGWKPDGSMWLRKLSGPFLDDESPLGHSLQHMANYITGHMWMPSLHLPPACYVFVRNRLMDAYKTGIAMGRVYELARQGKQIGEDELDLIKVAPSSWMERDDEQ